MTYIHESSKLGEENRTQYLERQAPITPPWVKRIGQTINFSKPWTSETI